MGPSTRRLLTTVGFRQALVSAGSLFQRIVFVLAIGWAAALVASRFFALIPLEYFDLRTVKGIIPLAALPVVAALLAATFARRPDASGSARLVDLGCKTKDVFLTAARIDASFGDYKPLVLRDAEARSGCISPAQVVRFRWVKGARNLAIGCILVVLGGLFLPQFDLLGKNEERRRLDERRKLIEESRKAAAARLEQLKKSDPTAAMSKEVEQALADLKMTFNQAKPKEVDANFKKLQENQKDLGQMWKQMNERKLMDALNQAASQQQFGVRNLDKQAEWKEQMSKGDAAGMKKELEEIANMARKLSTLEKGAERQALEQEMKQRMESLSDFVEREMNSRPCAGAMARAMEQLGLSGAKGLSKEAMEALQESLDVSGMELEKLAQNARDMQGLEQALKALQMAKSLNKMQALDGEQAAGCKGMGDYEKLYRKMMAGMKGGGEGEGQGEDDGGEGGMGGMGRKGQGRGGKAPEDPDSQSDFVPEQSRSAMTAGKILTEWKTKGMAEAGQSRVEYDKAIENVRKGVGEAILREQIPPGYHEAIQKYFGEKFGKEGANEAPGK